MRILLTILFVLSQISFALSNELIVYTYDSFSSDWGPGPQLKKEFETQCSCQLKFVALEDGVSILNRIKMEGKKSKADVVVGLDNNLLYEAKATGLFVEHTLDSSDLKVDEGVLTDDTFVAFDHGYFAFIYNSETIQQVPGSLKELVEDQNISVIYQDPRTSTPGQGLMLWMKTVYGDDAKEAWKSLARHTVTVTKGWYDGYSMFLKGESDIVLSYTTSPAYHQVVEKVTKYKAAKFSEGHYGQTEIAAVMKSSQNQKLANQFLKFLTGEKAQGIIPVTNWMLPARKGVTLPKEFDQLIQPKTGINFDSRVVFENRKRWIVEWRDAVSE